MKKQSVFDQFYSEYGDYKRKKEQLLDDDAAIQALSEAHDITKNEVISIIKRGIIKKTEKVKKMRKIIMVGSMSLLAVIALLFILNLSYAKKQGQLYNKAAAQQKVCQAYFDRMFKILKQKAGVVSEYSDKFKDIYVGIMEGRYSGGSKDGSLMKWIQESNPNFSDKMYVDLMETIEHERASFFEEQQVLIDIEMTYKNLTEVPPSSWFTDGKRKLEITIITSKYTKDAYETGEENDVDLFDKNN